MKNPTITFARSTTILLAALALYACGKKPAEQPPAAPSEPTVRESIQHVDATVEAIDPATREITLKSEHGSISFIAGPDVRNFDSIHAGDKVNVAYYEALAAELKAKGAPATAPTAVVETYRAPVGGTPAGAVGHSVTGTVKIESYDTATDTVVFVNSGGERHTVAVQAQNMKEFGRTLKPGDEVELTYTEAVAVEVVPAQ